MSSRFSLGGLLSLVEQLAAEQIRLYRQHPAEMRPHYTHERSVEKAYRGRQLLELIQNADDAGKRHSGPPRFLLRIADEFLIAANAGVPFSPDGITSLVISDRSPKPLECDRYIGQKGLGFRSLLSWSERPLVRSGAHQVAFDPEYARHVATEIARDVHTLRVELEQYSERHRSPPVPVMRFPFIPEETDPRLIVAEKIREEGYETVIVLPLPNGSRREAVVADIVRQAEGIDAATLLFSNHLTEIRVEVEGISATWRVERQANVGSQTVVLQRDTSISLWTIHRREIDVPQELLDEETGPETLGLAIAVPEKAGNSAGNTLCVFFPTSVALPTSVLAHATLETDDSRKRLVQGLKTEFALRELAIFLAEVCENEALTSSNRWRGLELLAGAERCDPELANLRFTDALRDAICARRLFPRIDCTLARAADVWLPPSKTWRETATRDWLGDLLDTPPGKEVEALVEDLKLQTLPLAQQTKRLEERVAAYAAAGRPEMAGRLIGTLLLAGDLPKVPLARILLGDDGAQLGVREHVLLSPEGPGMRRPAWATDIHFLHAGYADGIRSVAKVTARDLSRRLTELGYAIEEYQLDAVARRLVRSAELGGTTSRQEEIDRHLDVLGCVFEMAKAQDTSATITAPLRVLTERGNLRRANECYVGTAYPSGALLSALYRPLGEDEFCAGPEQLRLTAPGAEVERFLVRIGVLAKVRRKPLDSPRAIQQAGLREHVRETLARLTYPHELAERVFKSAEDAIANLEFHYDDYLLPDRWAEVLAKGSPEAIIAFMASEGLQHLAARPSTNIALWARYGQQLYYRNCRAVQVSDPMLYLLREANWVPGDGGGRYKPRRIVLSKIAK